MSEPAWLRTASRAGRLALALSCLLPCVAVVAEDTASPQAIVDTRRQGFKKMGAAMKAIVDQLKTEAPDNARMIAAAQAIGTSAEAQFRWFPAGTDIDSGLDTDALAHIWKDRAKFDALANRLIAESKLLNTALAGSDPAAVRAQAKVVADVCSTCHRSFRAD